MAALSGINADVYVTSTPAVGFVDISMTDSGDHKTYTISDAAKRYFDKAGTFTVETSPDGTTWSTAGPTTYTLQYVGGVVIFNVANAAGTHVRISGTYLPYSQLGQAHSWQIDIDDELLDASMFGSSWKTYVAAVKGAKATVSRYWLDTFFTANLDNATLCVLILYPDQPGGERFEAFAHIEQVSPKTAISALVEEELSFIIDGEVFYVA